MYRLNEETKERLIAKAKEFGEHELQSFQDWVGWEDWMSEFTESSDGEAATEQECEEIDKVLADIFRVAHEEEA